MKLFIRNDDKEESLLVLGVAKEKAGLEKIFSSVESKSQHMRAVLRPGEQGIYTLDENYFVGIELL